MLACALTMWVLAWLLGDALGLLEGGLLLRLRVEEGLMATGERGNCALGLRARGLRPWEPFWGEYTVLESRLRETRDLVGIAMESSSQGSHLGMWKRESESL